MYSNDLSNLGTFNIVVTAIFTQYPNWPDVTLDIVLTVDDPCESAILDPNQTLEIEKLFGYVYGAATTLQIDAPYDSVGISDGSYFCGIHDFELQGSVPDWLTISSVSDHSVTLSIQSDDCTDAYDPITSETQLRISLKDYPSVFKD